MRQQIKANAKAQLSGAIFETKWMTALLVCVILTAIISAARAQFYNTLVSQNQG